MICCRKCEAFLLATISFFADPRRSCRNAPWMNSPDSPSRYGRPCRSTVRSHGGRLRSVPAIEHLNAVARRFADRVAISDGSQQITYSDLLARVLTLAQAIAAATPEGQAVGSLLRNSVWQPIAMLACMAAGRPWSRSIRAIRSNGSRLSPRRRGFPC